jgi:CheY-like chemotaxis protein
VEGGAGFREVATILVVDDQEAVRAVIVNTLERYGYTVLDAAGGSDALSRCGSYPGAIHLVLADVEMEPIDGYETVRRILLARPGMKVIYVSGNLPDYSRAMPGTEFLMKGDELANSLRDKVRQMLSRR